MHKYYSRGSCPCKGAPGAEAEHGRKGAMKSEMYWELDRRDSCTGHCKNFGSSSSDESLGDFKQKDMISLEVKKR